MIEIRAIQSKLNGTRVNILRKTKKHNPNTQKISFQFKQLGSFFIEKELIPNNILETLDKEELFYLQNWLDDAVFSFQFNTLPESMDKTIIYLPEKLNALLQDIFIEAKKKGLKFSPHSIMLDALLKESKKTLTLLHANSNKEKLLCVHNDDDSKILFHQLIALDEPIGKICFELEETAKNLLKKEKKIPPPQLEDWAGIKKGRNPDKPIKKWAYSLAIDVLMKYNVNPINYIPYEKVAEYWCLPRHSDMPLKKAITEFLLTFNITTESSSRASSVITRIYLHYQLKNIC